LGRRRSSVNAVIQALNDKLTGLAGDANQTVLVQQKNCTDLESA